MSSNDVKRYRISNHLLEDYKYKVGEHIYDHVDVVLATDYARLEQQVEQLQRELDGEGGPVPRTVQRDPSMRCAVCNHSEQEFIDLKHRAEQAEARVKELERGEPQSAYLKELEERVSYLNNIDEKYHEADRVRNLACLQRDEAIQALEDAQVALHNLGMPSQQYKTIAGGICKLAAYKMQEGKDATEAHLATATARVKWLEEGRKFVPTPDSYRDFARIMARFGSEDAIKVAKEAVAIDQWLAAEPDGE